MVTSVETLKLSKEVKARPLSEWPTIAVELLGTQTRLIQGKQYRHRVIECGDSGDLNGDGDISILDIIAMINCILDGVCPDCSDLNADNVINIQDIIMLINIILK